MPIRRRTSTGSTLGPVEVLAVVEDACPSTLRAGMRSFIRLKQRMNVDLPQPDGPMNAVTKFFVISSVDVLERERRRCRDAEAVDVEDDLTATIVVADRLRELSDLRSVDSSAGCLVHVSAIGASVRPSFRRWDAVW